MHFPHSVWQTLLFLLQGKFRVKGAYKTRYKDTDRTICVSVVMVTVILHTG